MTGPEVYTRILKIGTRPGDASKCANLSWLILNESMLAAKTSLKQKLPAGAEEVQEKKLKELLRNLKQPRQSQSTSCRWQTSCTVKAAEAAEDVKPLMMLCAR
jgi:hypothetical protein